MHKKTPSLRKYFTWIGGSVIKIMAFAFSWRLYKQCYPNRINALGLLNFSTNKTYFLQFEIVGRKRRKNYLILYSTLEDLRLKSFSIRATNLLEAPPGVRSALSFIGGVLIGARALHVLNLIWFGYIARVGRSGVISSTK